MSHNGMAYIKFMSLIGQETISKAIFGFIKIVTAISKLVFPTLHFSWFFNLYDQICDLNLIKPMKCL